VVACTDLPPDSPIIYLVTCQLLCIISTIRHNSGIGQCSKRFIQLLSISFTRITRTTVCLYCIGTLTRHSWIHYTHYWIVK